MKKYAPLCGPLDCFETSLLFHESLHQAEEMHFTGPPPACELCGAPFANRRFMVDCRLGGVDAPWGCVCAECYYGHGLEIGWGRGQLYSHLKNGRWLCTAGMKEESRL